MSVMNIERRIVAFQNCEVRQADDGNGMKFVGYASVFNTPAKISNFREIVAPTAFTRAISEGQDVRLLFNHDSNQILGRNGKNMTLSVDDKGLRVEADLPNTTLGRDMAENIRTGLVSQMSFGFSIPQGGDEWRKGTDGMAERTLNDVNLFDVSPVTYPAYDTTTAEVRNQAIKTLRDDPVGLFMEDGTVDEDQLAALRVLVDSVQAAMEAIDALLGEFDPELDPDTAPGGDDAPAAQANAQVIELEKRAGKVLSGSNLDRVKAAMTHLQALIDSANNSNNADDAEMNSAHMAAIKRQLIIAEVEAAA